jgi:hypothetical protein
LHLQPSSSTGHQGADARVLRPLHLCTGVLPAGVAPGSEFSQNFQEKAKRPKPWPRSGPWPQELRSEESGLSPDFIPALSLPRQRQEVKVSSSRGDSGLANQTALSFQAFGVNLKLLMAADKAAGRLWENCLGGLSATAAPPRRAGRVLLPYTVLHRARRPEPHFQLGLVPPHPLPSAAAKSPGSIPDTVPTLPPSCHLSLAPGPRGLAAFRSGLVVPRVPRGRRGHMLSPGAPALAATRAPAHLRGGSARLARVLARGRGQDRLRVRDSGARRALLVFHTCAGQLRLLTPPHTTPLPPSA